MDKYNNAVKDLAPCGIDCSRCASNKNGEIALLSRELKEKLKNFENLAENMKKFMPIFEHYKEFSDILDHFSNGNCEGCRNSEKPACQCSMNSCSKKHNVDFCYQCSSFPCDPQCYNETILNKWKQNNESMQKIGVDNFYINQKQQPRY